MAHKTADEYLIYAFANYKANLFGVNKWRFVSTETSADESLKQANQLYQSQKYERIEVKKKSFDPKKNRYRLSTYEVLGKNNRRKFYKILTVTFLLLALIGQIIINDMISF